MDRYILFNADKFLKESKLWGREKKALQKKLEAIADLPAISNSEVHSTNISNPTETTVFRRLKIRMEIDRLDRYQHILEYGLSHITEDEAELIHGFYLKRGYVNHFVDECCYKYDCKPRNVYNLKSKAVKSFTEAVEPIL